MNVNKAVSREKMSNREREREDRREERREGVRGENTQL